MAHEGRGDIDQEKKGRPRAIRQRTPNTHAVNDFTTGWLPRAGAVQCTTSVGLLYPTRRGESGQ